MYWFIDTRLKNPKPFAIQNKDVAKTWKREYAEKNGPFKPVDEPDNINVFDEQKDAAESENESEKTIYDDMSVKELQDELKARGIEFNSKAKKAELIRLLVQDDKSGGE